MGMAAIVDGVGEVACKGTGTLGLRLCPSCGAKVRRSSQEFQSGVDHTPYLRGAQEPLEKHFFFFFQCASATPQPYKWRRCTESQRRDRSGNRGTEHHICQRARCRPLAGSEKGRREFWSVWRCHPFTALAWLVVALQTVWQRELFWGTTQSQEFGVAW